MNKGGFKVTRRKGPKSKGNSDFKDILLPTYHPGPKELINKCSFLVIKKK